MRVTCSVSRNAKKKRLFRKLKGYNKQSSYTMGRVLLIKKSTHQFRSRKLLKRDQRSIFIQRINAALRNTLNISYSKFMNLTKSSDVILNRKVLADLCFNDIDGFKAYAKGIIAQ
jgi:large subunit ribosomal protein L20